MDETSNRQLHYNRFRYYDPETAQYISPDPIGLAGGDRPYGYVHNPISWVDPLGLANYDVRDFTKTNGGSNEADFITPHSTKHKFDPNTTSTRNKTLYGQHMDVEKLRVNTIANTDNVIHNVDQSGNVYATVYQKDYPFNISTADTPTGKHRVFINHSKPDRSAQFPRYDPN